MNPETIAIIVFLIGLLFVVYLKRKHMEVQKPLFPLIYILLWRGQLGVKAMDAWAQKLPRFFRWLGYLSIGIGFLGMGFIIWSLIDTLIVALTSKTLVQGVGLVLPIKAKGIFYVPFFYWVISIFVLATVHEFAHGIYARLTNVKVKSSGVGIFAFILPLIPLAFVEPDEKTMRKKSTRDQLMVYSAGPFANVVTALVVMVIMFFVFGPLSAAMNMPSGVELSGVGEEFPAYASGLRDGMVVTSLDGINTSTTSQFSAYLSQKKPGETVIAHTSDAEYHVVLGSQPTNESRGYLGVLVGQATEVRPEFSEKFGSASAPVIAWIIGLFYWLFMLNLGIGLFNLVPIGPLDGGRMLLAVLQKFLPEKTSHQVWGIVSLVLLALLIANIVLVYSLT